MQNEWLRLVAALLRATHFEEAAEAVLGALLQASGEVLAGSRYAPHARLLRGLIHLRPEESYRRFSVLEAAQTGWIAPEQGTVESNAQFLASGTAWRALQNHRCAISIDVNLGLLQPHGDSAAAIEDPQVGGTHGAFNSHESQKRFIGRQASHVCVLPMRGPGAELVGMITLEVDCAAAMGQDFIWRECGERLQLLADIAAPYLSWLPLRSVVAPQVDEFLPVVGAAMANLMPVLRVFAQQEETLLISGPTGAGKTRLARWCHERSARRGGPFESLDLLTVPEDLQMAELFGWRRGAFTGAVRDNPGSVARAEGGTLFIDEIDKLSLKAQAGLLHLLESRTYRALGEGSGERRADVRFIIGTNANLRAAVRAGLFREDLYYRINVLPVAVPPLEERRDEIAPWARYMVHRYHHERLPESRARMTPEAERRLVVSAWPGNLRQLDNIVRRAYTLAMVDHPDVAKEVVLREEHVTRALSYEVEPGPQPITEALRVAAALFLREAQQRGGGTLDLDLTDAFRGFVLGLATQQLGRDDAFRLFGREALLKNRNHHRTLRKELEKVETLYKTLGLSGSPFMGLLGNDEE